MISEASDMPPLLTTALVVGTAVVIAISMVRVLAWVAFSRLAEDDPTEIEW